MIFFKENPKVANAILITRLSKEKVDLIKEVHDDMDYRPEARIGIVGNIPEPDGMGNILIATGGTSDIPVAEEAAVTAEVYGNKVTRLYDVGVSGIHRTLSHMDEIMNASVIIVVAGMEGALASVIGGLSDCPVIAVPTSVGLALHLEDLQPFFQCLIHVQMELP